MAAPDAVSVTVLPGQMPLPLEELELVTVRTGAAVSTVIVDTVVKLHPAAVTADKVYGVVAVGETVMLVELDPVLHW